jgi:(p)ppGpp synthase/HD superfamily hydrolase
LHTAKALAIVAFAFQNKFDKAGEPYFNHCYTVMKLLGDVDEDLKQIALFHDVFEDTKITAVELRRDGFSERVIEGIYSMTKRPGQSYEEYKAQVVANPDSIKVKMADLTHNSDIRRMKDDASQKDFDRTQAYMKFFAELQNHAA